jgi:hypothetical protein
MCAYPEWLIMLIGVLAVKSKDKTYGGIHRLSTHYWQELCGQEVARLQSPRVSSGNISKKSASSLEQVQDTCIKFFHQTTCDHVVSADTMMIPARGPVWHRKQQKQGIIPQGLTGLDTEATWS